MSKKDGKLGVKVTTRTGKTITLLNPDEKGRKYAKELKTGIKMTNEGKTKCMDDGSAIGLDRVSAAYRMGYLAARSDNAKCYNANQKKKNKANMSTTYGF